MPFLLIVKKTATAKGSKLTITLTRHLGNIVLDTSSQRMCQRFSVNATGPSRTSRTQIPRCLVSVYSPARALALTRCRRRTRKLVRRFRRTKGTIPVLINNAKLCVSTVIGKLGVPPITPRPTLHRRLASLNRPRTCTLLRSLSPTTTRHVRPGSPIHAIHTLRVFCIAKRPPSALRKRSPPACPILCLKLKKSTSALGYHVTSHARRVVRVNFRRRIAHLIRGCKISLPLLRALNCTRVLPCLQNSVSLSATVSGIVLRAQRFTGHRHA